MDNQKSAYIAIVGRPNVGKSTILNKLIGEKIAIVSKKPQTTRTRIMGVLTKGEDQLVFLDTPGLLKPKNPLGDYMVRSVTAAVDGVDACLLVTQAGAPVSKADEELIGRFKKGHVPAVLAINKIDLLGNKSRLMEQIAAYSEMYGFEAVVPVSAEKGDGMEELLAELVREKVLGLLEQEVPHGIAAVTEHMTERGDMLEIYVTLYCEKANHKGMLIGKGGEMLKRIGKAARQDMEEFFG